MCCCMLSAPLTVVPSTGHSHQPCLLHCQGTAHTGLVSCVMCSDTPVPTVQSTTTLHPMSVGTGLRGAQIHVTTWLLPESAWPTSVIASIFCKSTFAANHSMINKHHLPSISTLVTAWSVDRGEVSRAEIWHNLDTCHHILSSVKGEIFQKLDNVYQFIYYNNLKCVKVSSISQIFH